MKTLVEATSAFTVGAGVGRYARNVLGQLIRAGESDRWVLLHARPEEGQGLFWDAPSGPNVTDQRLPFTRRNADRLWHRLRIPLDVQLLTGRSDVMYSPDFTAPPAFRVPRMVTVHDLAFMTHPEYTTHGLRRYLSSVVPRQVQIAAKVAVVSEAVKHDVMRLLRVPEEKLVVARNGVDDRFLSANPLPRARLEALGIPERYFLMVGTIEPRKNHLTTLRALERAGVGRDVPLVLAGRPGWAYAEALGKARELEAQGQVVLLDYVAEDDLPGLYAGAQAVLYPSITEGFGLPVLEALAAGTAVLTGTAPALREVGGAHALYADPLSVEELAEHISDLASQAEDGPETREARRTWARTFSWSATGEIVLEALRDLAGPIGR